VYIKNWPEDGSLEPKHVANDVLMIIYIYTVYTYIHIVFDLINYFIVHLLVYYISVNIS